MIPGVAALVVLGLACAGIVALSERVGRRSALDGARWRQAHLPMLAAIVCGLGAAGHDPLSMALRAGQVAPRLIPSAFLWLVVGLPIAAASICIGIGMIRGRRVSMGGVWGLAAGGSLACGLALAGRIALLDGQLMMLAGLALSWWRAGVAPREPERAARAIWEAPAAYGLALAGGIGAWWSGGAGAEMAIVAAVALIAFAASMVLAGGQTGEGARIGDEAWSALGTLLMGLGIVTVGRIGVMGYAEAKRAAIETGDSPVFVLADVVWSGPYVGGLAAQAPEALWLLALAGVVAAGGREGGRRVGAGILCVGVGVAFAAWRLTRWVALGL